MIGDLAIVGPVGVREGHLERLCEVSVGHEHNQDHATIVIRGRIKILYSFEENGKTVEGETKEFAQGEIAYVKASVRHTIKAMEPGTWYHCVFSHRDFGGLVTQTYSGNDSAYL